MSCDIDIDRIEPHPQNANVMSPEAMKTLARHIARTKRYEPLVVRPHGGTDDDPRYQVLNGHHRLEVLRHLGHERVRCEVWDVDDGEALLLLATLNRLEGRDDPSRRAALLARLAGDGRSAADLAKLARLLPENRAALERALALAREPLPMPASADEMLRVFAPMTFFLTDDEQRTVSRALRLAARAETDGDASEEPRRGRRRAAALVAMAERFLAPASGATGGAVSEEEHDDGMHVS